MFCFCVHVASVAYTVCACVTLCVFVFMCPLVYVYVTACAQLFCIFAYMLCYLNLLRQPHDLFKKKEKKGKNMHLTPRIRFRLPNLVFFNKQEEFSNINLSFSYVEFVPQSVLASCMAAVSVECATRKQRRSLCLQSSSSSSYSCY